MNQYDNNGMLKAEFVRKSEIQRPEGFMENPYIGIDEEDYHSVEALRQANSEYYDGISQKFDTLMDIHPSKAAPVDIHPSKAAPADIHPSKAAPVDIHPSKAAPVDIHPLKVD